MGCEGSGKGREGSQPAVRMRGGLSVQPMGRDWAGRLLEAIVGTIEVHGRASFALRSSGPPLKRQPRSEMSKPAMADYQQTVALEGQSLCLGIEQCPGGPDLQGAGPCHLRTNRRAALQDPRQGVRGCSRKGSSEEQDEGTASVPKDRCGLSPARAWGRGLWSGRVPRILP